MKKTLKLQVYFALLLAVAPFAATAQPTTIFTDNFGNGSTLNGTSTPGGTPTASFTSYDIASTKGANTGPAIASGDFTLKLNAATTSGFLEAQALFTSTPFALNAVGDYINLTCTFTDTGGTLLAGGGTGCYLYTGLYNSGGYAPVAGGLASSGLSTSLTTYSTGNAANWQGYVARISSAGTSQMITRPLQNGGTQNNADQDLVGNNVGGGAYDNPAGTQIGSNETVTPTLTSGAQYTISYTLALTAAGTITITNALYSGVGTGGTLIFAQTNSASGATLLTSSFDGLAIGARNNGTSLNPTMDISSIVISGQSSPIPPPTITSQPVSVTVATNGSCAFFVSATSSDLSYQWHRNGTNLLDNTNISGSASSTLVISPAGLADVASGANGYYVTVTNSAGSTNSVTNSLALIPATSLIWDPNNTIWDLTNNANWEDTNNNANLVFNYGDPVTFNDIGFGGSVTLTSPYLSAASVTVNSTYTYNFASASSGSFAGPGYLLYEGPGQLTIGNANAYSGGTIISNNAGLLLLKNYAGLGTGPVTLAEEGGTMELFSAGSATSGIKGDVNVQDDFTIRVDGAGSYAAVFLGNLSGTAGKTLTLIPSSLNTSTNDRIRVYGGNTTNYANLALGSSLITFAPYNSSGSQTYNGVISGGGAIMEKGTTTYLNGTNTYSGGTFPVSGAIGLGVDSVGNPVTAGPVGTGPLLLTIDSTTSTTGSGQVFASGGAHTIANPIQYPTGTNNLTLIIGGANDLTFSGSFTLNGNDNITTNTITARTVQVTNIALTTFSGVISDRTNGVSAGFGLTITGNGANASGPLALNNTETYTGPTIVTNGATLQVNGSLIAASAVTVSSNATLAGTGTINGTVTVSAGARLAPGTSAAIGTLTISNNLALNGNLFFKLNESLAPQSNDIASVTGTLSYSGGGTLTVTNLGRALAVGDQFYLFNKGVPGGGSLTVTGGGAGVTWNNNLVSEGSISVASITVPKPLITSTVLSGTNLIFSGTNGTVGAMYSVLSSTNVASPLSAWTPMFTNTFVTGGAFSATNPIVPGEPDRFYVLRLQ